ncbi:MAG: hypothetical protein R3B13_10115 [Polyangiaceae bacterium]
MDWERHFRRLREPLLLAACIAVFAWHARHYWPFLSDDALISMVYARRLAEGAGLTWSDGQRVEGYTDLLWVLILAAAKLLGRDLISAARTLDAIGAGCAIAVVSFSNRELRVHALRLLGGAIALSLCAPLAVWAVGALEHGFMAGVLAAALLVVRELAQRESTRLRVAAGVLMAVLVLLRGDGVVLIAGMTLGLVVAWGVSWPRLKRLGLLLAPPAAAWFGQLLFRVLYYGKWVPQTALIKVSFNWERVELGANYVMRGLSPALPLVAIAVVGLLLTARRMQTVRWSVPVSVFLTWVAYDVVVGGDIFPGWRQLLFAWIALGMLLAECAETMAERVARRAWLVPALFGSATLVSFRFQTMDGENRRAISERWEWDGYSVGHVMRVAFGAKQPLLAVDAAGALPYWSGLPTVDMLGLNDIHIATHPPQHFGRGHIGHELGDGAYVFGRRPDIIAFNNAGGAWEPLFLSGKQMLAMPEFHQEYQRVLVVGQRGNRAAGQWWMRREGGVLGILRHSDRVEVPGYFFAGGNSAPATLREDELVTKLEPDRLAELPNLKLPAGTWNLEVSPPVEGLKIGYRCRAGFTQIRDRENSVLQLAEPIEVTAMLAASSPAEIRAATFQRTDGRANVVCSRTASEELPLAALSDRKQEHAMWNHPTNVLFTTRGVAVRLPSVRHAAVADVALDNNDAYVLRFLNQGQLVGTSRTEPKANGGGMACHRIAVPPSAQEQGFDAVGIIGVGGDGRYSVGHLFLVDK